MTGKYPFDWKFARIVPIPKSGNPEYASNYKPISILSILSKLLEKHVQNLISWCLNNSTPLSQNQWGFFYQVNQLQLLCFLLRMIVNKLLTSVMKYALYLRPKYK